MDILSVLNQVVLTLEYSKRQHDYNDDDNWYSCPLAPGGCANESIDPNVCVCGADEVNARIEETLEIVRETITSLSGV